MTGYVRVYSCSFLTWYARDRNANMFQMTQYYGLSLTIRKNAAPWDTRVKLFLLPIVSQVTSRIDHPKFLNR